MIRVSNSLDPDQARQNVEKVEFENNQQTTKKWEKFHSGQRVNEFNNIEHLLCYILYLPSVVCLAFTISEPTKIAQSLGICAKVLVQ